MVHSFGRSIVYPKCRQGNGDMKASFSVSVGRKNNKAPSQSFRHRRRSRSDTHENMCFHLGRVYGVIIRTKSLSFIDLSPWLPASNEVT